MATDWYATLNEQHEMLRSKAEEVAMLLSKPGLAIMTASLLYDDVEKLAQKFDTIAARLGEDLDADDPLVQAAEGLGDFWARLSAATVNRLREMQGLAPIEMPNGDHDEGK
ncbi:hypothetical protein QO002_006266 [Pararhizobium capsulatum DSM 1112]|uniref:Uncharacterized protein n=1 Tax=Pararhizobium capsulatum DSM 1112 TaxID=1121113 RepID=A0ABU0C0L8_9HYPH|nr:hypothetical protein [Pararhizobium capsulatum]MDQ0324059.1 hypothetical protein [Pararhizobium capsulatum DSM 1112]